MRPIRDLDGLLSEWLQEGPYQAPEGPLEAAIAHARRTPRRWTPFAVFRTDVMDRRTSTFALRLVVLGAAALVVAGLAIAGAGAFLGGEQVGPVPTAVPLASPMPSEASPSTPIPASPTPCPAIAPQALRGSWTVVIKGSDLINDFGAPPGTWTMTFSACAVELRMPSGVSLGVAALLISGNQITLPRDPNCANQTVSPAGGIYTFRVSGSTVTFTKVSDSCPGRVVTMTAHPWRRHS